MYMKTKYTKELLGSIVSNANTMTDVLRQLNLRQSGGNHSYISKIIRRYEIDTSHFVGQHSNLGKSPSTKKHWKQILVLRYDGSRTESYKLRRALIESGREYKCEECGRPPLWNNKPLRIQVDHKNGNWLDDRPINLIFYCPNCHSQTDGWSGSKGYTEVVDRNKYFRDRRCSPMEEALPSEGKC